MVTQKILPEETRRIQDNQVVFIPKRLLDLIGVERGDGEVTMQGAFSKKHGYYIYMYNPIQQKKMQRAQKKEAKVKGR